MNVPERYTEHVKENVSPMQCHKIGAAEGGDPSSRAKPSSRIEFLNNLEWLTLVVKELLCVCVL